MSRPMFHLCCNLLLVAWVGWSTLRCSSFAVKPESQPAAVQKDSATATPSDPLKDATPTPSSARLGPETDGSSDPAIQSALDQLHAGQLGGARGALESYVRTNPRSAAARFHLARIYHAEGKLHQAEQALRTALKVRPGYSLAVDYLTNLYLQRRQVGRAGEIVASALQQNPKSTALRVIALKVKLYRGDHRGVIAGAKALLRENVKNVHAMRYMALAYLRLKKVGLALYILQYALKTQEEAELYYHLGEAYRQGRQYKKAVSALERAVQLRRDFPEAHNNLGVLYLRGGAFQRSVAALSNAVKYQPNYAVAHVNLGNAYKGANQLEEAEQAYKRAIELDSSLAQAHYNLAIMYLDNADVNDLGKVAESERQLMACVDSFKQYRQVSGASGRKGDLIDKYLNEARRKLKAVEANKAEAKRVEEERRKEEEKKSLEEERRKAEEAKKAATPPSVEPATGLHRVPDGTTVKPKTEPVRPLPGERDVESPDVTRTSEPPKVPSRVPDGASRSERKKKPQPQPVDKTRVEPKIQPKPDPAKKPEKEEEEKEEDSPWR